jgi:hypothetical protein
MFDLAILHLSGPICKCLEQNLSWAITFTTGEVKKAGLKIICSTCKTTLEIPNSEFKARIVLKEPYPGKQVPEPEVLKNPPPKLEVLEGGKVIEFPKEEK